MVSLSTKTSLTRRRTTFCRSAISSVSADWRSRWRNAVRVSASRRNDIWLGGLIEDRLPFRPHGLLAGAQFRHPTAQFVEGQEIFLVGRKQPFHAFPDPYQLALEGFSPLLCRFRRAGCVKAPIEFGPNERWVFNQVNNFLPHDPVEQVLTDRPAVAQRSAEMTPSVRAEAAVVMDFARRSAGRRPRQRITAFAAGYQTLDDAGLDGPAGCEALVVSQPLRRQSKGLFADNRRHWYFDPFVTGPFVTATLVPMRRPPRQTERLCHLLPRADLRLVKTGRSLIGRVAQDRPGDRSFPANPPTGGDPHPA